jgi:hypothetical protein
MEPLATLLDHAADRFGKRVGLDPVQGHAGDGDLAGFRLGAGLVIDVQGQAMQVRIDLLVSALF